MKTLSKIFAASTLALGLVSFKSHAQTQSLSPGDTTTLVWYNNDSNFDKKRSIIYTDKRSVDSLVNVLAISKNKDYRIVYRREGREGKVVSTREFDKLNKTGVYLIMIAYNKKGLPEDDGKPVYILTSK